MEVIRAGFDAHAGRAGYEEICRRHIAGLADREELPCKVLDVGRLWDGRIEVDVAGIDRRSKSALLGECRWRGKRMGIDVLDGLRARADALRPVHGFKIHYALFSRSGFSTELEKRAKNEGVILVEGVPRTIAP